IWSGIQGAF
nr:RecName: Full=Venom peptide 1; AltName: Full=BaP-1 [Brotheas amazonicus]